MPNFSTITPYNFRAIDCGRNVVEAPVSSLYMDLQLFLALASFKSDAEYCLDAPDRIPAGYSFWGKISGKSLQGTCKRDED